MWDRRKKDFLIFIAPSLIIYFLVHLAFWPAQMSPDSEGNWLYALDYSSLFSKSQAHPLFSILWIVPSVILVHSPWLTIATNYILFSFFTAAILKFLHNNYGVSKATCILFAILFPLIPVNYILFTVLWKDIPYTLGFVILFYGCLKIATEKYLFDTKTFFIILSGLFLIYFMRYNGVIATFLSLIAFCLLKPNFKKQWLSIGAILLCIDVCVRGFFWSQSIPLIPDEFKGMYSAHFMGHLLKKNVPIEEKDYLFLNETLPIKEWVNNYNYIGVGTIAHQGYFKNPKAITAEWQSHLNSIGLKYLFKYPLEFVDYKWESALKTLTTFVGSPGKPGQEYRISGNFPVQDICELTTSLRTYLLSITFFRTRLTTPWMWLYFSLLLYGARVLYFSRRKRDASNLRKSWLLNWNSSPILPLRNFALLILPAIFNIASLVAVSTDYCYRYYYPTFVMSCFAILIIIGHQKNFEVESYKERKIS